MQGERALVLEDSLPEGIRRVVEEACNHACMGIEFAASDSVEESLIAPSLLVAVLPPGQRNVPSAVRHLATERFPVVPLLLLCDEAVVGDAVSLQDGRLTLLGIPHTPISISSRLRLAVSTTTHEGGGRQQVHGSDGPSGLSIEEFRHETWWGARVIVEEDPCAYEFNSKGSGFTFGASSNLTGVSPLRVDLHAIEGQWSFYASDIPGRCTLFSKRRLPPVWDIHTSFKEGLGPAYRLLAVPGDLLLFVVPCTASPQLPPFLLESGPEILNAAQDGGPALLDALVKLMQDQGEFAHVVVGEVR